MANNAISDEVLPEYQMRQKYTLAGIPEATQDLLIKYKKTAQTRYNWDPVFARGTAGSGQTNQVSDKNAIGQLQRQILARVVADGKQMTVQSNKFDVASAKAGTVSYAQYARTMAQAADRNFFGGKPTFNKDSGLPLPPNYGDGGANYPDFNALKTFVMSFSANPWGPKRNYGMNEKAKEVASTVAWTPNDVRNPTTAVSKLEELFTQVYNNPANTEYAPALNALNAMLDAVTNEVNNDHTPNKEYTMHFVTTAIGLNRYVSEWLKDSMGKDFINKYNNQMLLGTSVGDKNTTSNILNATVGGKD